MSGKMDGNIQLPNESIQKALDNIVLKKGFVDYKVQLSAGSKKGDNYLGVVNKVAVTGVKEDGEKSSLNLFLKVPVEGELVRKSFFIANAFQREIFVYEEIIRNMKQLEAEIGVRPGFTSYAECLATGAADMEEFLIMEDLTTQEFKMFEKLDTLDLKHALLVMEALGKFHALSFALKDKKPELFHQLSQLKEIFFQEPLSEAMQTLFDSLLKNSVDVIKVEGIYGEKWENFHKNYYKLVRDDCVKGSLTDRYSVINHTDCWNNNMLFKYENEEPTEVRLVDWQLSRCASPVLDVVHYIFCCIEKPLRDLHYQSLLDSYYQSLSTFLTDLKCDPEKLFPYSEFQNQLKKFGKFGLGMASVYLPSIVSHAEDTKSFEEMLDSTDHMKQEGIANRLKSRLTGVIVDVVDLGYL